MLTANGHKMFPLLLILVFVPQFEAGGPTEHIYVYSTTGRDVSLRCGEATSSHCPGISWLYNKDKGPTNAVVKNGEVSAGSARAARLSVNTSCSLVINNLTAEDVGRYTCRQGRDYDFAINYLSLLKLSPYRLDGGSDEDGGVTIECSVVKDSNRPSCPANSIRWVNETGTELHGDGDGYNVYGQTNCASFLTVKHPSGFNRKYTCQVVIDNKVLTEADYTPVSTRDEGDDQPEKDDSDNQPGKNDSGDRSGKTNPAQPHLIPIIVGVLVGMVVLLAVIAAVLIKHRKKDKVTEDVPKPAASADEPDSDLTYATVSIANERAASKKKVKAKKKKEEEEEEVTYSAVRTAVKSEADIDLCTLYSSVSKPPRKQ